MYALFIKLNHLKKKSLEFTILFQSLASIISEITINTPTYYIVAPPDNSLALKGGYQLSDSKSERHYRSQPRYQASRRRWLRRDNILGDQTRSRGETLQERSWRYSDSRFGEQTQPQERSHSDQNPGSAP